jgi:hypothetical protein
MMRDARYSMLMGGRHLHNPLLWGECCITSAYRSGPFALQSIITSGNITMSNSDSVTFWGERPYCFVARDRDRHMHRQQGIIFRFIHRYDTSLSVSILLLLWPYSPLLGLDRFFSFLILYTVGRTLERGISPSQGLYLYTEQHKHRKNDNTDIHALSRIRTHDPSFRAGEDSLCLTIDRAATVIFSMLGTRNLV